MQDYDAVYDKALRFLSRREYAEHELEQKLSHFFQDSVTISDVIQECKTKGFLSDCRYTLHYVEVKSKYGWGPNYIRYNLQKWQIDSVLINNAIASIDQEEWLINGCKWLIKRVGIRNVWGNSFMEKLLRRGFNIDQALSIKKKYLELD